MIEITLSFDEWLFAATEGCRRQIDGQLRGRTPRHDSPEQWTGDGWFWNINGASGEQCVAKWLGIPWDGSFGDLGANDVGLLEVRTTPGHDYPLRLHDKDKDNSIYILVTGVGPAWRIQGFILGSLGKQRELFHDRPPPACKPTGRPAYWVPQDKLRQDMDTLAERYKKHLQQEATNHGN